MIRAFLRFLGRTLWTIFVVLCVALILCLFTWSACIDSKPNHSRPPWFQKQHTGEA